MSWSLAFQLRLQADRMVLRYILECVETGAPVAGGHALGNPWSLSSWDAVGTAAINCIDPATSSMTHGEITPGQWTRTQGSMTLGLALDEDQADLLREKIRRGQLVQLLVGVDTTDPAQFEPVWLGVVRSLDWSWSAGWRLSLAEAVGGLSGRLTTSGAAADLFSGLSETTVASNYTAGNATIVLTDASGLEQSSAGSGEGYCILVTPTSGPPFYLIGTVAGNTLTITHRDIWNTDDADAVAGSVVREVAYTSAHPITIAARILQSTGAASNGPADLYPERWGIALPAELFDRDDALNFRSLVSSEGYTWDMRVTEEQPDALGWLLDWLRPGGFFLALHQGRITVRAILDATLQTPSRIVIEDQHIESIDEYHTWDPDIQVEYARWRATWGDVGTTAAPDPEADPSGYAAWVAVYGDAINGAPALGAYTLSETDTSSRPSAQYLEWSVPDVWRADHTSALTADTQVNAWATDIPARLSPWHLRLPERVVLQTASFRHARAAIGDQVLLTTAYVRSRFGAFDARPGVVLGGGPDWFGGGCRFTLGFPAPIDEG